MAVDNRGVFADETSLNGNNQVSSASMKNANDFSKLIPNLQLMENFLNSNVDDGDTELFMETDAIPVVDNALGKELHIPHADSIDNVPGKYVEILAEEEEDSDLIPNKHETGSKLQTGEFAISESELNISNSSVQIGNNVQDKSVNVASAKVVYINKTKYIGCYPENYKNAKEDQERSTILADNELRYIEKLRGFIRNRYRDRLSHTNPLPWNTRFSLPLNEFYTTLQLVNSDRFGRRPAHFAVSLEQVLEEVQNETLFNRREGFCRVLIEGSPGYGKTTLTLRIASDWASGKQYLSRFSLVFLIQLRDFQGDLQSYIFCELYPQEEEKGRDDLWRYVKENQEKILFVLDGLDELSREHRDPIDKLLKGNLLDKVSVVVTSRVVPSDDNVLSLFNRRIEIRGFNFDQTEQFVHNYFRISNKPQQASKLTSFLLGLRSCGRSLASCPLTCLLLCVLFDDEEDVRLSKMTDVYKELIACLIRRAMKTRNLEHDNNVTHRDYERTLRKFGYLCLEALSRNDVTFSGEQLRQYLGLDSEKLLDLGLLVPSQTLHTTTLIQKDMRYQPLHVTFQEYLAAEYLYWQMQRHQLGGGLSFNENFNRNLQLLQSEQFESQNLHLVLKFLAGLLGSKAASVFRLLRDFNLPIFTLFELLREAGSDAGNVRALLSLIGDESVIIRSNRIELEGWAELLSDPDCQVRFLKFQWTDSPLDPAALDSFFTTFQTNSSVNFLAITNSHGFIPDKTDVVAVAAFTAQAAKKPHLRHFTLELFGDTWTNDVADALSRTLSYRGVSQTLTSMKIDVKLGSSQITSLCQGIRRCRHIESLFLTKLNCKPDGYTQLASLLLGDWALKQLSVALNLITDLPPLDGSCYDEGSPEDLKTFPLYFYVSAQKQAGIADSSGFQYPDINVQEGDKEENAGVHDNQNAINCMNNEYHSSGFHFLFMALKDPTCQLEKLDLSGCFLGPNDFVCLGEALRCSSSLKSLRITNLKSFQEILPVIANNQLKWLDLSSRFVWLDDMAIRKLLKALSSTPQLESLSLARWKFQVTDPDIIKEVNLFFTYNSSLKSINVAHCRIELKLPNFTPIHKTRRTYQPMNKRVETDNKKRLNLPLFSSNLTLSSLDSTSTASLSSWRKSTSELEINKHRNKKISKFELRSVNRRWEWWKLVRLTLAATIVHIRVTDTNEELYITGSDLLSYMSGLQNLVELSVSIKFPIYRSSDNDSILRIEEPYTEMNDESTRDFFSLIHRRHGHTLESLHMSCCAMRWYNPSQTSTWLISRLRKCEKLVSLHFNYFRFRIVFDATAMKVNKTKDDKFLTDRNYTSSSQPDIHFFLDAVLSGVPYIEDLSLIGMNLTATQAISLGKRLRDTWKGSSLHIHVQEVPDEAVINLKYYLENYTKFDVIHVGGFRDTLRIQKKRHLCGFFRGINTKNNDYHKNTDRSHEEEAHGVNSSLEVYKKELWSSLPLALPLVQWGNSLLGITPFDYSILVAHLAGQP